ncbi:hypothetical protein PMAYCL1PPCAC_02282, partial [Pristionchus mayeri]
HRDIPRRLHALVDIGVFLLGFTIEEIDGEHSARARLFDLHTHAWMPVPIPILPLGDSQSGLPVDGQWLMQLVEYDSIVCIYSNPSNCRLIYIHLDRSPCKRFPISLFITGSRDIRPVISILIDRSLHCSVLYEREEEGVERVSIVTDDYQFDRNSVRVWEMDDDGQMVQIGPCNLTDTTEDFVMGRSARGDILMTKEGQKGIVIDRETGDESYVEINVHPMNERPPFFTIVSFFISGGLSFSIDTWGFLWSLDASHLIWKKHSMKPFRHGTISCLTISDLGRVLCVEHFKRRAGDADVALPLWQMTQPQTLKELAQNSVCEALAMDRGKTDVVHREMSIYRRGYDTTISFLISLMKIMPSLFRTNNPPNRHPFPQP